MLMVCRSRRANQLDLLIAGAIALVIFWTLVAPETVLLWLPDCVFSTWFELPCWGCDISHALIALMRGDINEAWDINPRSLFVAPLLAHIYFQYLRMIVTSYRNQTAFSRS